MAKKSEKRPVAVATKPNGTSKVGRQNSALIAATGIRSGRDLADLMSALISDVVTGAIAPNTANAACNAAGKLIRIVELEMRHGRKSLLLAEKPVRSERHSVAH